MSGSLRNVWEHLAEDIWEPLSTFYGRSASTPPDLFNDLFATAEEFLSPRPTPAELEEARNDSIIAQRRFLALKGADFASEPAIVCFLEETHSVVADYEIEGFGEFYRKLLRDALAKFNLRYRIDDPFSLRFILPGSFTSLYAELHRLNLGNDHLTALWADFESAFDHYARTQGDSELRSSIAKASNYLEGLASIANGGAGTLGKLCDRLNDWPHEKVKDAVKNLYGFCSDYPGIRHAGNPNNRKRVLDRRDSVAINVSLMALAAYLSKTIDHSAILGIGGPHGRVRLAGAAPLISPSTGRFRKLLAMLGFR